MSDPTSKLYRIKMNRKTIVKLVREEQPADECQYVSVVWSESCDLGGPLSAFVYRLYLDELEALDENESQEIMSKINSRIWAGG